MKRVLRLQLIDHLLRETSQRIVRHVAGLIANLLTRGRGCLAGVWFRQFQEPKEIGAKNEIVLRSKTRRDRRNVASTAAQQPAINSQFAGLDRLSEKPLRSLGTGPSYLLDVLDRIDTPYAIRCRGRECRRIHMSQIMLQKANYSRLQPAEMLCNILYDKAALRRPRSRKYQVISND